MTIPEYGITFSDTYKFFAQKLETLPTRFQLEELKGFFHMFRTFLKIGAYCEKNPSNLKPISMRMTVKMSKV